MEALRNKLKTPQIHGEEQVTIELKTTYRSRAKQMSKDHSHSIVYTQEKWRLQDLLLIPLSINTNHGASKQRKNSLSWPQGNYTVQPAGRRNPRSQMPKE